MERINGGVFFLRPCAATEAHMLTLLAAHPKLRFTHGTAEQDFFGWVGGWGWVSGWVGA